MQQANTACQGNYWNYSNSGECTEAVSKVDTVNQWHYLVKKSILFSCYILWSL